MQVEGLQNYYAENCARCGKKLTMRPDGQHEDENMRGYCYGCQAYLMQPAKITPEMAAGMANTYNSPPDKGRGEG